MGIRDARIFTSALIVAVVFLFALLGWMRDVKEVAGRWDFGTVCCAFADAEVAFSVRDGLYKVLTIVPMRF